MSNVAEAMASITNELNKAYAQRAQADDKIKALQNVLQGVNLGIEYQKALAASEAQPETVPHEVD